MGYSHRSETLASTPGQTLPAAPKLLDQVRARVRRSGLEEPSDTRFSALAIGGAAFIPTNAMSVARKPYDRGAVTQTMGALVAAAGSGHPD